MRAWLARSITLGRGRTARAPGIAVLGFPHCNRAFEFADQCLERRIGIMRADNLLPKKGTNLGKTKRLGATDRIADLLRLGLDDAGD